MANTSEQWIAASRAALETAHAAVGISLGSVEKLASHHLSAVRDGLLEQFDHAGKLLGARDAQELIALQAAAAQPRVEKAVAYFRGLHDISAESQEALAKAVEAAQAELTRNLSALLDGYGKSGGNADLAVAAVKSAISAANSAFENAQKAARQVADITEASVQAAASATAHAVGSAAPARKKAA